LSWRGWALCATVSALAAGCATAPPPITKIVNGRVIETRSVSAEAYEHVARAYLFEEDQRWQEAADELQRALPFDPDAAEVRAELAELFIRLDRRDDAQEQIQRSLEIAPTVEGYLAQAHLAEARADAAHPENAPAVAALKQACALALEDQDSDEIETTHLELADAQLGALDLPGALATLRKLVDAAPDTQRGRVELAAVAWPMNARDEAIQVLQQALDDEPADVDAWVLLGELQIAAGDDKGARTSFQDAMDRADNPTDIATAYAGWLVQRGDVAAAQAVADGLTADAPDVNALEQAAALERTVKRPDRALALAERARKQGAGAGRVALMIGAALVVKGDQAGAIAAYEGVSRGDPQFFEARLREAELLRSQGKLDQAAKALDQAAGLVSDDAHAVDLAIARSQLEEKRGDAARAARVLDDALAAKPEDPRLVDRLTLERASVDDRRGEWKRAVARAEELLAREPRNVEALNFAGFVAADHGADLPRAIRRLQAAMALSPGTGGIVDSLGWAFFQSGDLGRAGALLEEAGRLDPDDPEILSHLGDLYARRQEHDRALATYRRALTLSPPDRVARELNDRLRTLDAKSAAGR
jgi:tetratricopeptide (TPR) repeat protein